MNGNIQKQPPENGPPGAAPNPLMSLRQEVDRLFDNFFSAPMLTRRGMFELDPFRRLGGMFRSGDLSPEVDVRETETEFQITAELPGMEEKDIEVTIKDGVLVIAGEKKMETKDEKTNYHLTERSWGRFMRSFRLPEAVEEDGISAKFAKGVLTITLPKSQVTPANEKRIEIKGQD